MALQIVLLVRVLSSLKVGSLFQMEQVVEGLLIFPTILQYLAALEGLVVELRVDMVSIFLF